MQTIQAYRNRFRPRLTAALLAASLSWCAAPAGAVIIYGGEGVDAPANDTAPSGFEDAWNRIGSIGLGNGVYLGNGYVLTARHVAGTPASFTVDGTTYDAIAGTGKTLTNSGVAQADLYLYRIAVPEDTGLFGMDAMPIIEDSVANRANPYVGVLIGSGEGQVQLQPETLSIGGIGFDWAGDASRKKRWANAEIGNKTQFTVNNRATQGFESVLKFGASADGIAADNDSGAGLFWNNNGVITLVGIVSAVNRPSSIDGDPDATAKNNDATLLSDLSFYDNQIIVTLGDLSGDGSVTQTDLDLVLTHWGQTVQAGNWLLGDANGDGFVGIDDLDEVLARWGSGPGGNPAAAPVISFGGVGVPEPGSIALLTLGAAGLLRRRR